MADTLRQEKLASAKKKLKQFQQRRTPKANKGDPGGSPSAVRKNGPLLSPPVIEFVGRDQSTVQSVLFTSPERDHVKYNQDNNNQNIKDPKAAMVRSIENESEDTGPNQTKHHNADKMVVNTHSISEDYMNSESEPTPSEKIKQMSKQLNGLISQDAFVNGVDPLVKEMQELEGRNLELEQGLQSFKRSNQQLSKQVNDQRKQIIQLQDQLKKERSEHSGKQQQEHSAMKEQLQVHIQTIGILVSEKSELQTNVSSLQRKLQSKTSENEDVANRLQAARQRVVELERNAANLQMTCDKHVATQREAIDEKEKVLADLQRISKEKEELHQQNSELSEKLQIKVDECDVYSSKVNDLTGSLQKAQLVAHQLAPDSEKSDAIDLLHQEKEDMKRKLEEEQSRCQRLSDEYQQIRERYREHTEQLEKQVESLLIQVAELDIKESNLTSENEDLMKSISDQQAELDGLKLKLSEKTTAPSEVEYLQHEKERLEQELDIQIQENRRLGREVLANEDKISELETSVHRAEEELGDRSSLLESIQSDKETISRAMQQNRELKDQLEELQEGFVRMSNANAEATNDLQNEQHVNKELASKLSEMVVELEELKLQISAKDKALEDVEGTVSELKTTQESTTSSKDAELTTLREEILRLNERLEEQLALNDRLAHMEARAELTDRLQIELQSAQDNINQITTQNNSLRTSLKDEQEKSAFLEEQVLQMEEQSLSMNRSSVEDNPAQSKHFIQSPTPNSFETSADNSTDSEPEGMVESVKGNQTLDTEEDDSDSTEKQSINHFSTLEIEETVRSYQMTIENLTNEREELMATVEREKEASNIELGRLREHMRLQLQQQLQLQNRQLHEHFHQLLHEQQLRLNSLQETIDAYKKQEELTDRDLNENNISYDTIKTAFQQLQVRFKKVIEEKAYLSDRIQELEHKNLQLSIETETIGEYISLYHTQRQALKDKFFEKDRLISQLSNEHGRMQVKINQLQQLVSRILEERSGMEMEKRQLQEVVNKRLALQSGSDRSTEIPKLNYSLDSLFGQNTTQDSTDNYESETESTLKSFSDATLEIKADEEPNLFETPRKDSADGTALQIRQLFEQLHKTGEGFQHGWMSPGLRVKELTPCANCSHKLLHL